MEVIIQSPSNVIIDGENFGAVADCIANNPQYAAAIQNTLAVYIDGLNSARVGEAQLASDAMLAAVQARTASEDALNSTIADLTAIIEAGRAEIAANEALQAQLVAAATQGANARNWDIIDAVILQAHDTPAVIRDKQAKLAQKNQLLAEIAEREAAIAELS